MALPDAQIKGCFTDALVALNSVEDRPFEYEESAVSNTWQRMLSRSGLEVSLAEIHDLSTVGFVMLHSTPVVCNRSKDVDELAGNTRRHATSISALTDNTVCRVHAFSHTLFFNIERYRSTLADSGRSIGGFFLAEAPHSFGSPEKSEAHNNTKLLRRLGRAS
jgi:hypothetical protein